MLSWIRERAWLPASLLLLLGAGGVGLFDIGLRGPWAWGSLVLGTLLLGLAGRFWQARREPPGQVCSASPKLEVILGGKAIPYDLEKDESTNNQRYLM